MFAALRDRLGKKASASSRPRRSREERKEELMEFLDSLPEDERDDYYAAAKELAEAMSGSSFNEVRLCHYPGLWDREGVPAGVRTPQEMRAYAQAFRSSTTPSQPVEARSQLGLRL
ncbi:hypothetical protein [Prescottella agglutinans]|uniref:Uncharacterized protein n=1 Tax=Prescottella agglutinans TaxID=1644129 RepID=A0ABT6MJZ4_9NOCA|nr:hypothetical protein [Prescottella agglutinans]MDH6284643.1 hypothetical protein [Prescottella agglutinans]